jgi:hypothetical protein
VSKWVQWVPGAAIVGAAAAYIFTVIEARWARKRELKGLLRLLAVEIQYNEGVFDFLEGSPRMMGALAEGVGLQTRAWEENRARIAQLMKDIDELQDLADYFMNVAVFEMERFNPALQESLLPRISVLRAQGDAALDAVVDIVGAEVEPQVEGPLS